MAGNKKKETVTKTDKIMKKLIVSAISFFILTLWIYGQQSAPKPFSFKSAIIEYKYSGDKAGKSTQYVDDYGMKNAAYTEMLEEGETVKGWTVSSGDYQYNVGPVRTHPGYENEKPPHGLDPPVVRKRP